MQTLKIIKTSKTFNVGGKTQVSQFPIIVSDVLGVVPEAAAFLRYRYVRQNASLGTILDDAYVLLSWYQYLSGLNISHWEVTEGIYLRWIAFQERTISRARISRKINIVHRYSQFLERNSGYQIPETSPFHGDKPFVKFPRASLRNRIARPTPSNIEAERIADYLATNGDPYLSVRNFLICQWKIQVGLRDQGIEGMKLRSLQIALEDEGIFLPGGHSLASVSREPSTQLQLMQRIYDLGDSGRENLILKVTEKGNKMRTVPVPFGLARATLEFIWNERANLLSRGNGIYSSSRAAEAVWLSAKTGQAISAKAIGRLLKVAFNECGIAGSGHRLRALFACNLVWRLYMEAKLLHGSDWDANMILLNAADILGHKNLDSMRPYLDRVLREANAISTWNGQ